MTATVPTDLHVGPAVAATAHEALGFTRATMAIRALTATAVMDGLHGIIFDIHRWISRFRLDEEHAWQRARQRSSSGLKQSWDGLRYNAS
ncbi:hypothetical protein PPGU16_80600 (plasmid) [Paraburkholderia largidicola]|uniref:Uncharacterized protein n=1 Tax=Paraburkholderia largidicola TaxID=3014751 RepID=A0A7I8C2D2_9BURK|nr:hypothetical protein PPGU16_80600 [Paraburkholderia sp. PGU16]